MPSMIFDRLINHVRAFRADEDGAVTVDFVVMTSFVVFMGAAHAKDVADGAKNIAGDIDSCLSEDIAAMMDGDPDNYIANLQAAGAACSAR